MANNRFEDSLDALVRESKSSKGGAWEGTMKDYMALVHANPKIAQLAPGRIFDMLLEKGTTEITGFEKLPHYEDEVKYTFFTDEIFGIEEVLHDLVRFFRAGANRTETGKAHPYPGGPGVLGEVHHRLPSEEGPGAVRHAHVRHQGLSRERGAPSPGAALSANQVRAAPGREDRGGSLPGMPVSAHERREVPGPRGQLQVGGHARGPDAARASGRARGSAPSSPRTRRTRTSRS